MSGLNFVKLNAVSTACHRFDGQPVKELLVSNRLEMVGRPARVSNDDTLLPLVRTAGTDEIRKTALQAALLSVIMRILQSSATSKEDPRPMCGNIKLLPPPLWSQYTSPSPHWLLPISSPTRLGHFDFFAKLERKDDDAGN